MTMRILTGYLSGVGRQFDGNRRGAAARAVDFHAAVDGPDAFGQPEDLRASYAAEPRSTATFDIEDLGEMVKLTVRHDGFAEGSAVLTGLRQGWPLLLAELKTLLETGDVMTGTAS